MNAMRFAVYDGRIRRKLGIQTSAHENKGSGEDVKQWGHDAFVEPTVNGLHTNSAISYSLQYKLFNKVNKIVVTTDKIIQY